MKQPLILLLAFLAVPALYAQKPAVTWGDEFRMKKGSTDLMVFHSDKSGVYLQEGHLTTRTFAISYSGRSSARLVKLDKTMREIFNNNYDVEMKGKSFIQFFVLKDKIFVVASDAVRPGKKVTVFASPVNTVDGRMTGTWKPLVSMDIAEKTDKADFKISYNSDSSKMVVVSTVSGKEKNTYRVEEFDESLKPTGKFTEISNEFEPKTFQLEDIVYAHNRNVVVVGRVYEFREGKKPKEKYLHFVNYSIRIYDPNGKQINEIKTEVNGKWVTSTKVIETKDKALLLAGFYSANRQDRTVDGMIVQRIDPASGEVLSTNEHPIDRALLTDASAVLPEDEGTMDKAEKKEREKFEKEKTRGDGFSAYMMFRNIYYSEDGGAVILAENYYHTVRVHNYYQTGFNGSPGKFVETVYSIYECGDLMMCKLDSAAEISWIKVLPKYQREVLEDNNSSLVSSLIYFDYEKRPFYAGFGSMQVNNSLLIFLNDSQQNRDVLQAGKKPRMISYYGKSHCYVVTLDMESGKYTRKFFFDNAEIPTAMPRLGSVVGNEMYITGKDDRVLGKSKVAVGKITVKK